MNGGRPVEKHRKFADGARANEIEWREFFAQFFVAAHQHPSACKSKFANYFRQKCCFLHVRLDQNDLQFWLQDLKREARKAAARSNVGQPTIIKRYN